MIAFVDCSSPTAADDRSPEVREWASPCDYYEGPISYDFNGATAMPVELSDGRLVMLISETYDEAEALMGSLQKDLRYGDWRLAIGLKAVVKSPSFETSARSLALETLAGARVRSLDNEVLELIRDTLKDRDADLQFTAVAAASDLSRQSQVLLAGVVREIANSERSDYWVKRAAAAFLSRL